MYFYERENEIQPENDHARANLHLCIIQRTVIIFPIGVRTFAFFTPLPPATNLLSIRKIYE